MHSTSAQSPGKKQGSQQRTLTIERLRPAKLNRAARRAIIFEVAAWDLNCPQHIPQPFSLADVEAASAAMLARIAELEAEVELLKKKS